MEAKKVKTTDWKGLKALAEHETILWGQVVRVAQDTDKHVYMIVDIRSSGPAAGRQCTVYREEADAEFKSGSLVYLVGHRVPVVLLSVDEKSETLLASRKAAQEKTKVAMLNDLSSGREMRGTILNFVSFGAYVEVNGVVGLLKNTDYTMDFSEINETKKEGDSVVVICKEVTSEGKIFWTVPKKVHRKNPIQYDFEPGTAVLGTVQNVVSFDNGVGVFVRIATGLDALCTIPQNVEVENGTRVSVRITKVEPPTGEFLPPRVKGSIMRVV